MATDERGQRGSITEGHSGGPARPSPAPPDAQTALGVLDKMLLIRRFEERSQEMYMKARIGGFLHLCIGEEATIVGAASVLDDADYLVSTYREHGQALARGTDPGIVMAELFGREGGCSRGRGGSMHLFDAERRVMGGYGIVGGNLPLAAGMALASKYLGEGSVSLCMFGDGASNQGTFGETMNLAALWRLPIVFLVVNNQYGMGTALSRHSAVTNLSEKARCFGIPGERVDGMDVLAVRECMAEHLRIAREEHRPTMVESLTYRFRGHSAADPEVYRTKDEVEEWRERDPVFCFADKLKDAGLLDDAGLEERDRRAVGVVDRAVEFADASPEPALASLYDDVYVLGDQVRGWYSVDERTPEVHRGEHERDVGTRGAPQELAQAGAAHASAGEAGGVERRTRSDQGSQADQDPPEDADERDRL